MPLRRAYGRWRAWHGRLVVVISRVSGSRLRLCLEHDSPLLSFEFLSSHFDPHLRIVVSFALADPKLEASVKPFKLLVSLCACHHKLLKLILFLFLVQF